MRNKIEIIGDITKIEIRQRSGLWHHAIIDTEDLARLMENTNSITYHDWGYAKLSTKGKQVYLHRFIYGDAPGLQIDHINHNKLDNRKANLRPITAKGNAANARHHRKKQTAKFGEKYISWCGNAFRICIIRQGKRYRSQAKTFELAIIKRDKFLAEIEAEKVRAIGGGGSSSGVPEAPTFFKEIE